MYQYHNLKLLAKLVENRVKTNIVAAFKLIQNRTCIQFRMAPLTTLLTSAAVVVFRKGGNRYLLYMLTKNFSH